MMFFSKDIDDARLIPARIASCSFSLLDAGKSNRMACSIISPIGTLRYKPTTAPVY